MRRPFCYLEFGEMRGPCYDCPMDPIAIAFYAIICGCLSAFAPSVPRLSVRVGIGAGVGIVAAAVLPLIKDLLMG